MEYPRVLKNLLQVASEKIGLVGLAGMHVIDAIRQIAVCDILELNHSSTHQVLLDIYYEQGQVQHEMFVSYELTEFELFSWFSVAHDLF